jgi:hypothetical protein
VRGLTDNTGSSDNTGSTDNTGSPDGSGLHGIVARLTDDEPLDRRTRAGLVGRLAVQLGRQGRHLVDAVVDIAPHIPVRDRMTLLRHFPGLDDDAMARQLIATAARASAAVGAAGGVLSTVEMAAPPMFLSAPVQVAAETLAVVAIEVKLIAELHEIYNRGVVGSAAVRGAAYLGAWVRRRGLDPLASGPALTGVVGGAARRELRQRLLRRAGRNATSVIPFLAGAVAGASLNRRETSKLGERIHRDLRGT